MNKKLLVIVLLGTLVILIPAALMFKDQPALFFIFTIVVGIAGGNILVDLENFSGKKKTVR